VGPEGSGTPQGDTALRERLAELESAINWQTSCLSCARLLDASYADHARAEEAERERDEACAAVQRVRDLAEKLAGLAPADDWGNDMPDTVAADVARRFLAALDRLEGT
jgi:hypothetical protein